MKWEIVFASVVTELSDCFVESKQIKMLLFEEVKLKCGYQNSMLSFPKIERAIWGG